MKGLHNPFKKKAPTKDRKYRSEAAEEEEDPEYYVKKRPQLDIGEAPPRPPLAGAGLAGNTIYQMGEAVQDANGEAADAAGDKKKHPKPKVVQKAKGAPGPYQPIIPDRPGIVVHTEQVAGILLVVYVLFLALFVKWLRPSVLVMAFWVLVGGGLGVGYSFLHHANRRRKAYLNGVLNLTPGRKGLKEVLGHVPTWIAFQDREKVEWLNRMLAGLWPYYDRAIAAAIREAVEPVMDQYKPPGLIKKIYFKTLTFGDAPFQIDDVWVEQDGEPNVTMELSFRWAGDANIALAIELPAGGEATRLVPKVTDLQIAGVARIVLAPLVPDLTGFGAVVASLRKPPLMHFRLDFGAAFGGSITAKAVRLWLDPFIRETLTNMLVWPNRLVVPMLPESVTGPLDDLYLRHVGLLVVHVAEARGLRKMDTLGKSDPFVELYTQPHVIEKTEVQKNTLTPVWKEDKWLLVQEPKTQMMRLQVFDRDIINVKEMMQINIFKGLMSTIGSKTFMGRCAVPLRKFLDKPGELVDDWYDLGRGEWANDDGAGTGEGQIRLVASYWPFDLIYSAPRDASLGAVLVTVVRCADLPAADSNGLADPYVTLKLDDQKRTSATKRTTLTPVWNEKFEWLHVPVVEIMEVTVWDADLASDQALGMVEIDIAEDVAKVAGGRVFKTWYLEEVPHDVKTRAVPPANITLQIQWVPFDFSLPYET